MTSLSSFAIKELLLVALENQLTLVKLLTLERVHLVAQASLPLHATKALRKRRKKIN